MDTKTEITTRLHLLASDPKFQAGGRPARTTAIQRSIGKWAEDIQKWKVYYTGHERERAWLFDVTVLDLDDGWLRRVPLVVESELGSRNEVHDDFQRLLVARADLRVMIFQDRYVPDAEKLATELQQAIERCAYSRPEDRYLIAYYSDSESTFVFRST